MTFAYINGIITLNYYFGKEWFFMDSINPNGNFPNGNFPNGGNNGYDPNNGYNQYNQNNGYNPSNGYAQNNGYGNQYGAPQNGYAQHTANSQNYGSNAQSVYGGGYEQHQARKRILAGEIDRVMRGVYMYMFIGLLITAVTALATVTNEVFAYSIIYSNVFYALIFAEIGVVLLFSALIKKMSPAMCMGCFVVYSILSGLTLSVVLLYYTGGSVASAFGCAALTFGTMSAIGYTTKKDLTSVGHYCLMGLIGIIIAGVVNMFIFKSLGLEFALSAVGLLIFVGLTAYDTQKIKERLSVAEDGDTVKKIMVWGALNLYLDFINIFLKLLRLMGKRR